MLLANDNWTTQKDKHQDQPLIYVPASCNPNVTDNCRYKCNDKQLITGIIYKLSSC